MDIQVVNGTESFNGEDLEYPEYSGSGDQSYDEAEETKIRVGQKFADIDHLLAELEEDLGFHLAQDGQSMCGVIEEYQSGHQKVLGKLKRAAWLKASSQCDLAGGYGLAVGSTSTDLTPLHLASGVIGLMGLLLIG